MKIWERIWPKLLSLLVIVAIVLATMLVHIPNAHGGQIWRMQVTFGQLGETICAHYEFDSLESCERAVAWFEKQAAWHGQNTYTCVLDSQCPNN